jgi:hypothetical protein
VKKAGQFANVFVRKGRQERLQTKTCSSEIKGQPARLCYPSCPPLIFARKQYIDPIIAATWSDDGAIHDVCKALSPRFREPNSIVSLFLSSLPCGLTPLQVVFKALIVLHTMIRNGATDNVLQYLSSSEVLRLKNVVGGQWEGLCYGLLLPVQYLPMSG